MIAASAPRRRGLAVELVRDHNRRLRAIERLERAPAERVGKRARPIGDGGI